MNMKDKYICFYTDSLSMGGAEKVSIYLAKFFQNEGIKTSVLTNKINNKEYDLDNSIRRISLANKNENISNFKLMLRMQRFVNEKKPDAIVVLGTSLITYLAIPILRSRTKVIVSERNSPENFSGRRITQFISNKLMKFASGYVFQTKSAEEYYNWITSNKTIIENPLFLDELPQIFDGVRNKNIVNIGRLHEQKNQKLLIESFSLIEKKFPEYNLIIYGEGNQRVVLEQLVTKLQLNNRIFLPGSYKDVLERIKGASVFVLSSDFEGMPNALIEAMALGLPVVSTDSPSGGPRELINDGVNGLLTPIQDKNNLAEKIEFLLSNPKKAEMLGENAVNIREKLSSNVIGQKWIQFVSTVLD